MNLVVDPLQYSHACNDGDAAMQAHFEKHSTPEVPIPERMERYRQNKSNFPSLKIGMIGPIRTRSPKRA